MLVHSLETIHEKYKDSLADLQDVTSVIKEYQKEQMAEVKAMPQTTNRDWILRKQLHGDELRFCQPCLKWHHSPGVKLGSLHRSP